jgi:hypothetical protein
MIVQDHMTTKLITVKSNTSLWKAWEMMQTHRIRHLPVIEGKRLVGRNSTDPDPRSAKHHTGTSRRLYPGHPRFDPGGDPDDPRSALGHGGSACAEGYRPQKTAGSAASVGAGPWDTPSQGKKPTPLRRGRNI